MHENRLIHEKSPYLLQHAKNPVDWYPWGQEAFQKAKAQDKMIFLSIGYSTCHWCHVMEKESFENEEIARLLNEFFIPVKVDREERPDIDHVYMNAIQAMTGSGGWPLTVFLTPEGHPVTGGTYFPPEDRWGRPGMQTLALRMSEIWKNQRGDLLKTGKQMTEVLGQRAAAAQDNAFDPAWLEKASEQFEGNFDPEHGGFGGAPKFPRSHDLSFLLRHVRRNPGSYGIQMAEKTLEAMALGGIYDHLGGGFHRYSTDEVWLVPHFEKMLYDQALIARTCLEAYQVTGKKFYAEIARGIFEYVLRDMTGSEGGFYSAEDADSEGEEGKFYVWNPSEIRAVLSGDAEIFMRFYGVTKAGNFEHGASILHAPGPVEEFAQSQSLNLDELMKKLEVWRKKLLAVRAKRIPPYKDDKILTAWNGLMISALAMGARVLDESQYIHAAEKSADFILSKMVQQGRLMRRFRDSESAIPAFQEDYASFAAGLLDLYETSFNLRWLKEAKYFTDEMVRLFWDAEAGGFFYTGSDAESLIVRSKEYYDGAVPSGNSIAALVLLRLARMTGNSSYETKAEALVQSNAGPLAQYPVAFPHLLTAVDFALGPSREIVIAGPLDSPEARDMLKILHHSWDPWRVLLHYPEGPEGKAVSELAPYLKTQKSFEGKTGVYVCENQRCLAPVMDAESLRKILGVQVEIK